MRIEMDHLPITKQRELERVVEIIFHEFREAIENATGRRKRAQIKKIILFGSYARGGWVDAPASANQYKSDYDILIIVNDRELTDRATYWAKCEEQLVRAYTIEHRLHTPVNFIVHTLQEVNDALSHGRVFFIEIKKEGIALYQSDDRELREPVPKTPKQAVAAAREYFEEYMPSAQYSLARAENSVSDGQLKYAAFDLHQATERLYQGLLLTLTFYTPYNHNVAFLRSLAEGLDARLHGLWPESNRRERALFQKLKDAYVKARYSRHYQISEEDLAWLRERIEALGSIVHQICAEKIAALVAAATRAE